MARLTVDLLGGFRVSLESGACLALPARKAQALVAYLALDPGRAHQRNTLAALLWGERGDAQARKSLRQAVYALRKALPKQGAQLLLLERETVALNPAEVEVDAPRFERLVREGAPEALERAAALYRGDFLQGFGVGEAAFEEWLGSQRERLRELAIEALAKLLAHHAKSSGTERGIQTAMRLLALDPLQEVAHRTLMRLYARQGRRAAGLRQYQACVDLLQRELRAEPEAETKQLYQELLQQRLGACGEPEAGGALPAPRARPAVTREQLGLPVQRMPLIGRHAELEQLRALSPQAEEGRGQVAIVLGEAGIGKTRLLAEIAVGAIERGSAVLLGRAFQSEQLLAFGPWVAAIRESRVLEEPGALDALAPTWRSELARLFPEISESAADGRRGGEDYLRLFEAIERLLAAITERHATVLLLEDLHWADEMSLRLLSYIGRRNRAWKLLVMASAREEELGSSAAMRRAIDELARDGRCVELTLAPLTRRNTMELVRSLARAGAPVAAGLEEQIWTASEGNPFMAVEMVRAIEQGTEASPTTPLSAPERVRTLIAGRLDRLSERARHVAAVAAVFGRECDFGLLQRAAGLPARDAAETVEELARRRVLDGAGERLDFTHDRIREVAYQRLLPPTRQVLHQEVVSVLEAVPARDEHVERLAYHAARGELWDKALTYLGQAGTRAMTRSAYREAAALLALSAGIPPVRSPPFFAYGGKGTRTMWSAAGVSDSRSRRRVYLRPEPR